MGGVFQPIFFARSPFAAGTWSGQGQGQGRLQSNYGRAGLRASGHQGKAPGRVGRVEGTTSPQRVGAAAGPSSSWREAVAATVTGLGYELVDIERMPSGTLRVFIDRLPGRAYAGGAGEFVTVEDCEQVTRQLQYALEVDAVAYTRLEVSSPGLDRPLKREADYERFVGHEVCLTLKLPFQGRKVWKGVLVRAAQGGDWCLELNERRPAGKAATKPSGKALAKAAANAATPAAQVLGFTLDEVREARLVPVVDFKGRQSSDGGLVDAVAADSAATGVDGG